MIRTKLSNILSEEDIRPTSLMLDKQSCVDEDRAYLLDRSDQWVTVFCPACDEAKCSTYGDKLGFRYVQCERCATVYTNPRPTERLLHDFYSQSKNYAYWNQHIFPATEITRRTSIFAPRAARVAQYCREQGITSGTLVEVGSAFGTFCEEIKSHGIFKRIVAIEPTPDLAATCRKRGFETIELPIECVKGLEEVDVIAAFEVLEHLFSPIDFIRACKRILKPSGLLILTCPNARGFDLATLGMRSGTFDHEHINYFHTESLPLLLNREGFLTCHVETPGQLDSDLVRNQILAGTLDIDGQPLLKEVLIDRWDDLGPAFQRFLADNQLSSHMWVVARKLP